jgi:hypothetical protein
MVLIGAAKVVGVEHTLVVRRRCGATRRLEENRIFFVGINRRLRGGCVTGLRSLSRFGRGRLSLQLLHGQRVPVLTIFARHGITELLQALGPNAKLLRDRLFCGVVGEEDEGLEGGIGIVLLIDAPQDMAEEGLEVHGDSALGSLPGARELAAVAGRPVWRLEYERSRLLLVPGFVGARGCDALTKERLGRLWALRVLVHAVGGAHRGAVGHVEGVERALEILVVVVLVGLAVFHGQKRLGQHELLHLGPCGIGLLDALKLDAVRDLAGDRRDLVEPLDGFATVGVDALGARLQAVELGEGWWYS